MEQQAVGIEHRGNGGVRVGAAQLQGFEIIAGPRVWHTARRVQQPPGHRAPIGPQFPASAAGDVDKGDRRLGRPLEGVEGADPLDIGQGRRVAREQL